MVQAKKGIGIRALALTSLILLIPANAQTVIPCNTSLVPPVDVPAGEGTGYCGASSAEAVASLVSSVWPDTYCEFCLILQGCKLNFVYIDGAGVNTWFDAIGGQWCAALDGGDDGGRITLTCTKCTIQPR